MLPCFLILLLVVLRVVGTQEIRECSQGEFRLPLMPHCRPMLNCSELGKLRVGRLVGVGGVKAVYKATFENIPAALSILNNPKMAPDFFHGQRMLAEYTGYPGFVRLLGFCKKPALTLTEFHPYGSVANLSSIVQRFKIRDDLQFRLSLCRDWARILQILHGEGPIKSVRVMCDSNSIRKLLSQILLDENLRLVLNDLDALPRVENEDGVVCGHGPIEGELVAPEQRWPHPLFPYSQALMPGYTEKIDIWKAAKLCDHFLRDTPGQEWTKFRLFALHRRCLQMEPSARPRASDLVQGYQNVLEEIIHDEL